ncbi:DUF3606 domain-containing protein [Rhodanobacter sp. A1T4]|uniref:DUF3606 domain-containing protein n=1 Tax=Rhodanobacter sp. A1T4 TaxID=2723087 RepID=UPI00161FE6C7|nr:DUF3606 domain-containing protein [Rhodanobacter sp. A1T4]MBB6249010.1 hypothetical protein [Rhodanobacter sp. A1T4]
MPESFESQEFVRTRINVNDKYEIAHWTARLNISEQHLQDAVSKVGVMVVDVEREIRNNNWISETKRVRQG